MEIARDARGVAVPRDVTDAMAAMPAVFPRTPSLSESAGSARCRSPSAGPLGATRAGRTCAPTFRLDSLARHGELAYVSMRGEIVPDRASRPGRSTCRDT